jgi:hypothetical protein
MNPVMVILKAVAVGMLLGALGNHPHGYYLLLRCVVCGAAALAASQAADCQKDAWAWAFSVLALVFNPLTPAPLGSDLWLAVNVVSALLLLLSIAIVDRKTSLSSRQMVQTKWIKQKKGLMALTMVAAACLFGGTLFLWEGITHVGPGVVWFGGGEDTDIFQESVPETYYREDHYEMGGAYLLVAGGILWYVIRAWRRRRGNEESWKRILSDPAYVQKIRQDSKYYPDDFKQWIEENHPDLLLKSDNQENCHN